MTSTVALPLLDALRASAATGKQPAAVEQSTQIAEEFVAAALDEYRHIEALDRVPDEASFVFDRQTAVLLRQMFADWATHAEALLDRLGPNDSAGAEVKGVDELSRALGRTRAMLSVTLEDLDRAAEQLRTGKTHSLEEVRREVRSGSLR